MMRIGLIMHATAIATMAHALQTDRAGKSYIFHPLAVAQDIADKGYDDNYIITALLHDVAEDTRLTAEDIEALFPGEANHRIHEALKLLTHDKNEPYIDYICKLKGDDIARAVKMADLRHNMDLSRLSKVTEADKQRLKKYQAAYTLLEN